MTVGAFDFESVALLTRRYEGGIEVVNQWRHISTTASFAVIVIYFDFIFLDLMNMTIRFDYNYDANMASVGERCCYSSLHYLVQSKAYFAGATVCDFAPCTSKPVCGSCHGRSWG
jgi:hypothetical protein